MTATSKPATAPAAPSGPPLGPAWRRRGYRVLVVLLALGLVAALLVWAIPAPPSRLTLATGFPGGAYEHFGQRYAQALAASKVTVTLRPTQGSLENLALLSRADAPVQAAFVQGGVGDAAAYPGLVSLGRINRQVLWIFQRPGLTLQRLQDLAGLRLALGPAGSGTRLVAERLLALYDLDGQRTRLLPLAGDEAARALLDGRVDVVFMAFAADAPVVQRLLHQPGVTLMSVPQAEAISRRLPFLERVTLPQGVVDLGASLPPRDIELLSTSNAVLVREDLHADLVQELVEVLRREHGQPSWLDRPGDFPKASDPEYPVSGAAQRYYRQGPSLLQRLLPYWLTAHAERLLTLLAAAAALLPLVSQGPRLYRWYLRERMRGLYKRLRGLESQLDGLPGPVTQHSVRDELEALHRAVRQLQVPIRHSDLFFELLHGIQLVRRRLDELAVMTARAGSGAGVTPADARAVA
ncbi:TAXI family TRAP transporter solute-binding subunit [Pelomonas sp. APW6]|uniref:TAXI family TRAP transporter solute-binding subunit n=1 Tax=Roseateles subflavus TaxID=3053353 RepID=A0ABT7LFE9_9BURK|nr:TAXI family TRAP transporter solute-binding subunit [Pelomonas sp. APW6]MDL5031563.1 TAXI family TRAP transporter solute-binding subunit [Pelomonas sp. APW6]